MAEVTQPLITAEVGMAIANAISNIEQVAGPQGPQGVKGEAGPGFAAGGATGQVLVKNSANNYDTKWESFSYNNLADKPNFLNMMYPVGSIYLSVNNVNPAGIFGGEWVALQNRFLVGAGSDYNGGATGGVTTHTHSVSPTGSVANHTLTTEQVPAHTHTRGTMNITGSCNTASYGEGGGGIKNHSGAIVKSGSYTYKNGWSTAWQSSSGGGFSLDASQSWTGETSSVGGGGAHNHGLTLNTVTSASTTNLPPYLAVYMWKRTA